MLPLEESGRKELNDIFGIPENAVLIMPKAHRARRDTIIMEFLVHCV